MDRSVDKQFRENAPKENALLRTINYIKQHDDLKDSVCYNMFTHDIENAKDNFFISPTAKRGAVITGSFQDSLCVYLSRAYGITPTDNVLNKAILDVAYSNHYHPIKKYLEALVWDRVERLDFWLNKICNVKDDPFSRAVGRKLFMAMVKRIYEPGCKFDILIILEGEQGIFKSSLIQAIGGQWYAPVELTVRDRKMLVESMRGKWLLEVEELAGFRKQDFDKMKAFLSCSSDRVRLSYERRSADFKRQSILVATYNPEAENRYLNDMQNRRFWAVEIPAGTKIRIDEFKAVRDQLFAEAMVKWKEEKLYLEGEEAEVFSTIAQENRRILDPWTDIINAWLEAKSENFNDYRITGKELLSDCLGIPVERHTSALSRRLARSLKEIGWLQRQETTGTRSRYWVRPCKTNTDDWAE